MGIEHIKRWHWAIIGVLVGAAMAYMHTSMVTPDETTTYRRGISAFEFCGDLRKPKTGNGFPWLTDIVVYPPVQNKNYVTAKQLEIQTDGRGVYRLVQFNGEIPFKVARFSNPNSATYTVRDYLTEAQKDNADLKFSFAWWEQVHAQYAIWTIGGLLIIGGAWPTIINLMIGAGLGQKKTAEEAYDLERFGKTPEPAAPSGRPVVTAADQEQLSDYQETLEKNLAGAGMQMTTDAPVAAASEQAPVIKTLNGGPADPVATPVGEAEDKEYKGDYYPVAKPTTSKEKK